MNERIKEFARQAGFKVDWQHEDVQAIKMAQYKEFARLIVEECADLYKNEADNWFGTDTKDVLNIYSKKLKQHFGVEL